MPQNNLVSFCGIISIKALASLLHVLGVYLLRQIKGTRTNQNIILINMSLLEILSSTSGIAFLSVLISRASNNHDIVEMFRMFSRGFCPAFYFIMFVLTFDRLAMSLSPLKYQATMTVKKLKTALMLCWFIGAAAGVVFAIVRSGKLIDYINATLSVLFLLLIIIAYAIILCKIIRQRQLFARNVSHGAIHGKSLHLSKMYYVSGLIIFTYAFFIAVPNLFLIFYPVLSESHIAIMLWALNDISDPCLYIFLQKPVRTIFKTRMLSWRTTSFEL